MHTHNAQTHTHLTHPPCQSRVWVVTSPEGAWGPVRGVGSRHHLRLRAQDGHHSWGVRTGGQGPGILVDTLDA